MSDRETPESETAAEEQAVSAAPTSGTDATPAGAESASPSGRADTGTFDSAGTRIVWRAWLPEQDIRGVIALSHGAAEHSGRYEHVAKRLNEAGFAVYALDHAGHGGSGGARANIGSIDNAADNTARLLDLAGQAAPGVPRFVLGHSMGALIVLHLATRAPLDAAGIVVSAPPLDIPLGNSVQRLAASALSRLAPNIGVLKLDSADISRDPAVVAAYDNDPLVFRGKLPARTAVEVLLTAATVRERLDRLTVPTLAMHGTADAIAAPSSIDRIESGAGTSDLTIRRYDGLYHEIFNDPERDRVLSDVVDWLLGHIPTN